MQRLMKRIGVRGDAHELRVGEPTTARFANTEPIGASMTPIRIDPLKAKSACEAALGIRTPGASASSAGPRAAATRLTWPRTCSDRQES